MTAAGAAAAVAAASHLLSWEAAVGTKMERLLRLRRCQASRPPDERVSWVATAWGAPSSPSFAVVVVDILDGGKKETLTFGRERLRLDDFDYSVLDRHFD